MLQIDVEKLPTYRMGLRKGEKLGKEKGAAKEKMETIRTMSSMSYNVLQIALIARLPVADIERFLAGRKNHNA